MRHASRSTLVRMMKIDQALRANRWPNAASLGRELGVSRRTIGRDVESMRYQMSAPIEFDGRHNGFYYAEPTFRLSFPQLSQGELLAIYLAERMLRQFRGTPFEPDLHNAIQKLEALLPDGVSVRLDAIADFLSVLPATESRYDPTFFCSLTSAVVRRMRLDLKYWSAGRNETTRRVFDPYELSLVDDGWYAMGYCHLRGDIRMFAVQRVLSLRETGETFDRPPDFRAEDYLSGSFRAVRGDGDHDVVLRFKPDVARRFAEKKWHASQVLEPQNDGSLIARLHLTSLVEIKRWVMWWGTDCEVLEPAELRDTIAREIREMLHREEASRSTDRKKDARTSGSRNKKH